MTAPAHPRQAAAPRAERGRFEGHEAIVLSAGELSATFVDGLGMVGVSLCHRGEELLDRQGGLSAYAERGAVMGIPLLHPWANRLAAHSYAFAGRAVRLPAGPPLIRCEEHGLPIHGLLGATPYWRTGRLTASEDAAGLRATLDFAAHPELAAAFPFPHELELEVALRPAGLRIATTVRAVGETSVPVSFGFHPYLRLPGAARETWQVTLPDRRHLAVDDRAIPTGAQTPEPSEAFALGERIFDDGYAGIAEGAAFRVEGGGRALTVTLDRGYPFAQIFSPAGAQFICFEPMTAATNALRSGSGLRRVRPGEAFTAVFSLTVDGAGR
jgi:galactose mutarotase-like enzyme